MGLSDKARNAARDALGKAKEIVGKATDNDKFAADGRTDQIKASAKKPARRSRTSSRADPTTTAFGPQPTETVETHEARTAVGAGFVACLPAPETRSQP